jgi:hypothetical protein
MITYQPKLTQSQRQNLLLFLKRTPLKGEEAQALVEIVNAITAATPETPPAIKPDRVGKVSSPEEDLSFKNSAGSKLET